MDLTTRNPPGDSLSDLSGALSCRHSAAVLAFVANPKDLNLKALKP